MGEITVDEQYRTFLLEEVLTSIERSKLALKKILELTGIDKRLPDDKDVLFYMVPSKSNEDIDAIRYSVEQGYSLDQMGIECYGRWVSLLGVVAALAPIDGRFIDYLKETDGGVRGNYPLMAGVNPNVTEDIRLWAKLQ